MKSKQIYCAILLLVLTHIFLLSCSMNSSNMVLPQISNKYSNSEIDSLISMFRVALQNDIKDPPYDVKQSFFKDFPKSSDIEWEEGNHIYKVEFEIKSTDYKAYYDQKGILLMYKEEINTHLLPAVVKNSAISQYPDFNFEDLEKIVKGTQTFYEIEMERGGHEIKFVCYSDGRILENYYPL